jgi:hypothetical protein
MDKKVIEFFELHENESEAIVCNDAEQTIFTRKNEGYAKAFCKQFGHSYKVVNRTADTTQKTTTANDGDELDALTVKELTAKAEEMEIEIPKKATKAVLLAAIRQALQANKDIDHLFGTGEDDAAPEGEQASEAGEDDEEFTPTV